MSMVNVLRSALLLKDPPPPAVMLLLCSASCWLCEKELLQSWLKPWQNINVYLCTSSLTHCGLVLFVCAFMCVDHIMSDVCWKCCLVMASGGERLSKVAGAPEAIWRHEKHLPVVLGLTMRPLSLIIMNSCGILFTSMLSDDLAVCERATKSCKDNIVAWGLLLHFHTSVESLRVVRPQ